MPGSPPLSISALWLAVLVMLAGCVTERQTDTARTATEELLVSAAADRAAEAIGQTMPTGRRMFVDTTNFDALDGKYAIGAVRDALARHGNRLVDKKEAADLVVEIRSGTMAMDTDETLVGIPSYNVPIPLSGGLALPKLALYDDMTRRSVAKFAATGLDPKTGALIASSPPQIGAARKSQYTVLLFFSWNSDDLPDK